jgi:hypothetical protein
MGFDWGALGAGAAIVSVVGAFLAFVVRMTIKSTFSDLAKDFASMEYVKSKIDVHEQVFHGTRGAMKKDG